MFCIAIDGPSGAGKSSVAKMLSKRLGISYFNTGDIYRAVALCVVNNNVQPEDEEKITELLKNTDVYVKFAEDSQRTYLNGKDVTDMLHTTQMNIVTPAVGKTLSVREFIVKIQRKTASSCDVVMEGRDIGAVILPNANYKFFITASVEERAKRALKDLMAKGENTTFEVVKKQVEDRDFYDWNKPVGPLKKAEDCIEIFTDDINLNQVVDLIISHIKR